MNLTGADLSRTGRILLSLLSRVWLASYISLLFLLILALALPCLLSGLERGVCLSVGESQGNHYPEP